MGGASALHSDIQIRIPTAILVAVMISAGFLVYVGSATAATEDEIENAIVLGLAWLADQQGAEGYFGSSGDEPRYKLAQTGLAVLKFEQRATELGKDPFDENYEYHEQVEKGLDYLFSATSVDEDRVDIINYTYTTSIAMMAVAASNNPDRTVGALGSAVDGWTFKEVLQGMMNWLVYAQQTDLNHPSDEGGWYYRADEDDLFAWADQSNTGYATLALGYAAAAAPYGFGLTIPENVFTRLNTFINNIQDPMDNDTWDGGSWYNPCPDPPWKWVNILKTGNLLYEMALVGDNLDTERVQNAISYIENHWNDTGPQPEYAKTSLGWKDSYQAMFTMMKGFEALGINTITVGGSDIDWFDEVSDVIVTNQRGDGYWEYLNTDITEGEESPVLRAAWAMLTLERVIPLPTPKMEIKKVDEAGAVINMPGATFTISPDPETGTGTLTVVDGDANDTNPANGIILIENVLLNIEYTVTETAAPADYELDPTPQTVTLTYGATVTLEFTNKIKPGSIEIKKVDKENNPLGGATFKVEPNPYDGAELLVTDGDFNDSDPTDGLILLENVPLDNYTVTENVAPAGYEADPNPQIAEVDSSATVTLQFTNKLKPGSLEVTVIVDWNGATPDNTKTFEIYIMGPSYPDNDYKTVGYNGGVLTWDNLIPGTYTVTETYPGPEWTVTGEGDVTVVGGATTQATVTNTYAAPGSLEVTVVVDWNGVTPDNAKTFEICVTGPSYPDNDYKTVGYNGGVLTWDNLMPGTYTVTETYPGPEWTVTGEGDVTVVGGATTQTTVTNTYVPGSLEVTVIVDWDGATPDTTKTFEICITGPSYPENDCKTVGYNGGVLTWDNLMPGTYSVTETDPGPEWTVTGEGDVTVIGGATTQATIINTRMTMTDNFRKEFTEPMVWTETGWVSLDDWHIGNGTPGQEWVPLFRKIKWTVTYYVPNTSGDTMYDAVLKDRFGAELDQADPGQYTASQGSVTFEYSTGEMKQLRITWDIGDLPDGTIATLSFDVVTKENPPGKQEYTSPGRKTLNSGAVLKWKDASSHQDSMSTPSCYVMAWDGEGDMPTMIDITPNTLNLASKGKWITCHIELHSGYSVENIDVSTIRLIVDNDNVPAEPGPTMIVDQDNKVKLMVKFSRSAVQAIVSVGEVELTVIGEVAGVPFEGSDVIRVIDLGYSTLQNARLGVNLNLDNGQGLAIRFYTYAGGYQGENVLWDGAAPTQVVFLGSVPHPEGRSIENIALVLTDEGNAIPMASIVVGRSDLMTMIRAIKGEWSYASQAEKGTLFAEIRGIKGQWPYAPS